MGTVQRRAPVTWSQLYEWVMQQLYELSSPRIPLSFTIPESFAASDVEAVLRKAVERNEALRTTFEVDGSGELMQVVADPAGPLDIEVVEAGGAEAAEELVQELTLRLVRRPFAVLREWPLRAGVVATASGPRHLIVVVDHVAVDALGTVVLRAELAEIIQAVAESREPAAPAPGRQPADQAAREQRLARAGVDANAVRYFDEQLGRIPPRMFASRAPDLDPDGGGPAFRMAAMRSPAALACLRRLSERYGVTEPVVLLAAYAALLSLKTGCELCAISDIVGNRLDPKDRAMLGCLLQPVVISVDLGGDPRFSEVVRRAAAACREGYRHARYPTDKVMELQAVRAFERGAAFDDHWVKLNYIDFGTRPKDVDERALSAADPPASEVSWLEVRYDNASADVALLAVPDAGALTLRLQGRAAVITAGELERMLRGLEHVLFDAATGDDPRLSEVGERTQVGPPDRDERWVLVGGQWADVRDVETLLRSAPGVSAASVFHVQPEDGEDGGREEGRAALVAYLVPAAAPDAEDVTPLALRRFVLASLARWPSVVAPDRYVICRAAPSAGPDAAPPTLSEWRRQDVVLEGSGRSIPEVAPRTDGEKALCRAIAQVNGLPSVSVEASYILAGGKIRRIPAVQLALGREGYGSLSVRDLVGSASLRQVATELTRT